jgi:Sulfatase-modifying factor enzyme 1
VSKPGRLPPLISYWESAWEKAARGTDGRIYPYKGDYNAAKANTNDTGIGRTSAMGAFPNGASPYGVMDMSGNVWEWRLSAYNNPALDARTENEQTNDHGVMRGGSRFNALNDARAVLRISRRPAARDFSLGFRVVVVLHPPSSCMSLLISCNTTVVSLGAKRAGKLAVGPLGDRQGGKRRFDYTRTIIKCGQSRNYFTTYKKSFELEPVINFKKISPLRYLTSG